MKVIQAVWVPGLTSLALLIALAVYLLPLHPNIVALQFTFTAADFGSVLGTWTPQGVALFRAHLPVDCLLLLDYGVFGYLLARHTSVFSRSTVPVQRFLLWAMPLAAVCDLGENALHWYLTSGVASAAPGWYLLAGLCSMSKFALMGVFGVSAVWQRGGRASSGG
jgi:hypothetical protein